MHMNEATLPIPAIGGSYLANLLAGQAQPAASPLAWLNALRREALERVSVLTPTDDA